MKEGWKYKKLGEVATVQNGFAFDSQYFNEVGEGTPLIRIRDIKRAHTFTYTTESCSIDYVIKNGDVLIGMDGDFNVCSWEGGHAFLNQRVCRVIPSKAILPRFIYYLLPFPLKQINDKTSFSTVKHLSSKQVNNIVVPIPSFDEQLSIVARLDAAFAHIDALKANAEKQLAEARQLFQAELAECMRPKEGWEEMKFTEVCDIITDFVAAGSFADLRKNVVYNEAPDYAQLVRTTDLKHNFENKSFVYVSEHAFNYLWRVNLNEESIILPNVGVNCGEVYYVNPNKLPYKCNVLGPNAILVRSHKYDNLFLSYLFKGKEIQTQLRHITSSMAQPKYNKTNLKNLMVSLPSLEIQRSIVSRLDALSANLKKLEEVHRKTLAECDALKQAMLREVFE